MALGCRVLGRTSTLRAATRARGAGLKHRLLGRVQPPQLSGYVRAAAKPCAQHRGDGQHGRLQPRQTLGGLKRKPTSPTRGAMRETRTVRQPSRRHVRLWDVPASWVGFSTIPPSRHRLHASTPLLLRPASAPSTARTASAPPTARQPQTHVSRTSRPGRRATRGCSLLPTTCSHRTSALHALFQPEVPARVPGAQGCLEPRRGGFFVTRGGVSCDASEEKHAAGEPYH